MPAGRPLGADTYPDDALDQVTEYIAECDAGGDVPTKAGLAIYMGCVKNTLVNWAGNHPDFLTALEILEAWQEKGLITGGLKGTYNSTIAKLLLHNHGYSDKADVTSAGEKLEAPVIIRAPQKADE